MLRLSVPRKDMKGEELKRSKAFVALVLAFIVVSSGLTVKVSLADSAQPHGVISLAFDDSWQNQYTNAFPLMQAGGMVGTFYEITGDLSTNPTGGTYQSFAELQTMQSAGDEIGSHSVTHPDFTTISDDQINYECSESKAVLQSYGLIVNNFAYPYGAYNAHTDSIVEQYYRTARLVYCSGDVLQLPYYQYSPNYQPPELPADQGDIGDAAAQSLGFTTSTPTLSYLESIVDTVYSTNEWAVIYFHQILPNVVNSPDVINTQTFTSFLNYIKSKGVPTLTVNEALNLVSPPAPPPSVTINPTSAGIDIGQSQKFSSSITGGNPTYSYQWYLNNAAVSGATQSTWTFSPSSTGNYNVYLNVTDALGYEVQSNIVTGITVYPRPAVSISPASVSMDVGQSKTFTATPSGGSGTYTSYQWYVGGSAQSGATASTFSFVPASSGSYSITVTVTDSLAATSAQSSAATVTVNSALVAPTVSASKGTIDQGQSSSLTSTTVSTGTGPYTYQWMAEAPGAGSYSKVGSNSTSYSFVTTGTTLTGSWNFKLQVTDSSSAVVTSNAVSVTVNSAPTVSVSPTSWTMDIGQSKAFTAIASGGSGSYTGYQWYVGGTAQSGATASTFSYSPGSAGTFSITVTVTDSLGATSAQSTSATVTVSASPTVSIAPVGPLTMDAGQVQVFAATVRGGSGSITYQWYLDGSAVGTNSASYSYIAAGTSHLVTCKVTDSASAPVTSPTSNSVSVTVNSALVAPTVSASKGTVDQGQTSSLTSTAESTGTSPYTYQWLEKAPGGSYVDVGTNSASYSFATSTSTATGAWSFELQVTDSASTPVAVTSTVVSVTVNSAPTVSVSPTSWTMDVGQSKTFTATPSGGSGTYTSYQWYVGGSAQSGATASTFSFVPASSGSYSITVTVTDSLAATSAQSNTVTVNVYPTLVVSVSPTNTILYYGQSQTFTASVLGGAPSYNYQWYLNGASVIGANSATWMFTPTADGTWNIYVIVTDGLNDQAQSNAATVSVYSVNLVLAVNQGQSSLVGGQTVTFEVDLFNLLNPSLQTSLTLTVTGASNYGYYDTQPISVNANSVGEYTFSWTIPNVAGMYVVEVGLAPAQLTAYDVAWLKVT